MSKLNLQDMFPFPNDEKGRIFKVVQFYYGNPKVEPFRLPFLRFSDEENGIEYHDDIVMEFSKEKGFELKLKKIRGDEISYPVGDTVTITGAGRYQLSKGIYMFWEESQGYDMGIDENHIRQVMCHFPNRKFNVDNEPLNY